MGMMTRSRRKSDESFGFFINLFFPFWLVIRFALCFLFSWFFSSRSFFTAKASALF